MSVLSLTLLFLCIVNVTCQDLIMLVGDMLPAIHHVSLKNSRRSSFNIRNISRPIAIDYDAGRRVMYWTDVMLHQIWSLNRNTSETKAILTLNENSILDGLAVDTSRSKIFYTDAGNDLIGSINTDGTGRDVILNTGLDQPRAIVLHEERGKIYWTDWGNDSYIASANYKGSGIRKIVTSGLGWPNGLTLDKENGVLYWCDALIKNIEAVNVDGTGRRLILREPLAHYFDLFYLNEVLFFTDWKRKAILNIPARGGAVGSLATETFGQLTGIHVVSTADFSKCPLGQYGAGCVECGHCKEDTACDKTTGICLAGCTAGYTNQQCKQRCPFGSYGPRCMGTCQSCFRGCHHVTGVCHPSVEPNEGSTQIPIGKNDEDDDDDDVNKDGDSAFNPNHSIEPNEGSTKIPTGKNDDDSDKDEYSSLNTNHVILIGAVAGGVVVLLVIVVVVIIIVVILLRKKRQVPKPSTDPNYMTLERNRPQNLYSVASDLPPAYATVGDLGGSGADYSRLSGTVNSQYCYIQPSASCEGATGCLSFKDESNGKSFSAMA